MKLNKHQLIDELEAELNDQISVVTGHYLNMHDDILLRPAKNGGWSIIQCLDHLNSYGNYYLPQINLALERAGEDHNPVYTSGWLGDYFTKIMSPETGTKKYKAFKGHIPQNNLNSAAVLKEFLHQERLLSQYVERARNLDLSVRIPVSISKWITLKLGDTFRFIVAHNRRHILQAEGVIGD